MATYKLLTNDEIDGVLKLQSINLKCNLSEEDRSAQGFLTISHSKDILLEMNSKVPGIVAMDGNEIVGFCLSMSREFQKAIPILVPMFDLFGTLSVDGILLDEINYITVGQVCVHETHRGKGIFMGLYNAFRDFHRPNFEMAVTEIAVKNTRSLAAHVRRGFKFLHQYTAPDGEVWNIVFWDWN